MQPFGALTECESFVCFAFVWRVSWRRLHRRGRPSGIYTAFRLLSLTELLSQKQFIYVNDEINSFTMKLNPAPVNELQTLERIRFTYVHLRLDLVPFILIWFTLVTPDTYTGCNTLQYSNTIQYSSGSGILHLRKWRIISFIYKRNYEINSCTCKRYEK